jgi:glycosyltransferase EpsE
MTKSKPLVSIIIGTYNPSHYILLAIESIFNQTYKNIEVIICNDGTNLDTSKQLIKEILNKYPQIKFIESTENKGLSYALNSCISIASGDYIARMDDDDYSLFNRIETQVNFLENNPKISFVGSNAYIFDEYIYGRITVPKSPSIYDVLDSKAFIHPSIMFRKKTIVEVNSYAVSPDVIRLEDMDLWFRLISNGEKGINLETPLILYRENRASISKRTLKFRIREVRYKLLIAISLRMSLMYFIKILLKFIAHIISPIWLYKTLRSLKYQINVNHKLYYFKDFSSQLEFLNDQLSMGE